jgi:hypothetical protein
MDLIQSNWGSFYDDTYGLLQRDDADRKKIISEDITASDFTLQSYLVKEDRSSQPRIDKTLRLSIGKMAVKAGETMLLLPNQITKEEDMASQVISRKTPILVRRSTLQSDTIYITLLEGFTAPGNNLNQSVTSKFGEYRATTNLEGNTIRYIRTLTIYKGLYPPKSYSDFLDFFEKVAVADNKKLALKRSAQ